MKLRHPYVVEFLTLLKILKCDNSRKAISSTFEPVLFIMLCKVELPFESMDANLMSDQLK